MGIPVAYHLPYVGQYLYDNPRNGISIVTPTPLEHSLIQVVGISEVGAYLEAASTVIPFASPAQGVFIRTPSSPLIISHSGHPYGGNCWAALNRVTKAGFHRC
jgi:mandelonitrile lyase